MTGVFKSWSGRLALLLCSVIVSLEGGSYLYLIARQRAGIINLDRYIRNEILSKYVEFARRDPAAQVMVPHERLGWYRAPSVTGMVGKNLYITDQDGARHSPRASGPRLVSTYGDSFTEGLEADNGETWPAHLSYKLGIAVQNYAVSGYGPDQALLYLEENMARGTRTPIVILAFIPENLNRLVSAFRPFYTYPRTDFVAFKPIFVEGPSGHFETKYFAPSELSADALVLAARQAGAVDYWFKLAKAKFSTDIGSPNFFRLARMARQNSNDGGKALVVAPPARELMRYVIRRFHEDSQQYDFVPVVAALPGDPTDFRQGIKDLDEVFSQSFPGLVYLDVSKGTTRSPNSDYRDLFGATHYSARANEEVARVVANQLRPYVDSLRAHTVW
jgi:hypothetical protein